MGSVHALNFFTDDDIKYLFEYFKYESLNFLYEAFKDRVASRIPGGRNDRRKHKKLHGEDRKLKQGRLLLLTGTKSK